MKEIADSIQRVGLFANPEKPRIAAVVRRARVYLTEMGRSVCCDPATAALVGSEIETSLDVVSLADCCDLILVFGGDGTMLRIARQVAGRSVAILGVNAGHLGFLTTIKAGELTQGLAGILRGEFEIEERVLLEATINQSGTQTTQTALNDFVLSRGAASRLIEVEVEVNGELLTRYRCDGLIASSPTGSTAYSLAAGGAIVSPDAEVLTLTPICPHTLSIRPVVVSLNAVVKVTLLSRRQVAIVAADGHQQTNLTGGDTLIIRRSSKTVRLLRPFETTFFSTLRAKFGWNGSNL
jgi:NAD+ kinase